MAANECLSMVLGILCFVITPVMTSRSVQYVTNPGLTGKKCPSAEQILSETAHSVLQCTAICHATTGCESAFYNHETGTCYGCYGYYSSYTTAVALVDEASTTYHYPDLCEKDWARHGFSCYSFQFAERTWQNGLGECRSLDGSLVEITDSDENNFLSEILPSGVHVWIGLNQLDGDGVWRWKDSNLVLTYPIWGDGQPNGGSNEMCVLYHNPGKVWLDFSCSTLNPFVCEKPLHVCPTGWARYGFSCYSFQVAERTWQNGLDECRSQDGSLVEITNSDENNFLLQIIPSGIMLWIGLNHLTGGGVWRWADSNSEVTYKNWNDGQPNSLSEEHCVLYQTPSTEWYDFTCSTTCPFVCEKPLQCPFAWTTRGNSCYRLSQDQLNWDDALNSCRTQNAYLVEVNDAEENTFLQTLNTEGHELWLGLNDIETENTYRWAGSNALMTYTHWNDGEPNGHRVENCVWMFYHGKWNDFPCLGKTRYYVCEKAVELVNTKNSG